MDRTAKASLALESAVHPAQPGATEGLEANPGAEMPGIGGDDAHRLGGGLKQDAVDNRLVLEGYRHDLGGQCKYHVEIGNR